MPRTIDELYKLVAGDDQKAEDELFAALADKFRLFAHRKVWNSQEAEDIVQNALMVVTTEYRKVEIETSFSAWAYKIIENRLLGYIQKRRREKGRNVPDDSFAYLAGSWTPDPVLKMKLLNCLRKIGSSNRRYARILNLHQIGFSRSEVCKKLGMHLQQSYMVMSRARAMLRECLDKGDISR